MSTPKIAATAAPSSVRMWARDNGYNVGTRGRLHPDVIKAYNAAHGLKYREAAHVETVEHTVKPQKGRKVTRKVNIAMVREAAREAGVTVGERGRLPREVLDAYVLGTLRGLATVQSFDRD